MVEPKPHGSLSQSVPGGEAPFTCSCFCRALSRPQTPRRHDQDGFAVEQLRRCLVAKRACEIFDSPVGIRSEERSRTGRRVRVPRVRVHGLVVERGKYEPVAARIPRHRCGAFCRTCCGSSNHPRPHEPTSENGAEHTPHRLPRFLSATALSVRSIRLSVGGPLQSRVAPLGTQPRTHRPWRR